MHELYIRYSAEEKETIVLSVKRSELSIVQALKRLGIPRRTFFIIGIRNMPQGE